MFEFRSFKAGATLLALAVAPLATAAPIVKDLGGGWQVTIFQPDQLDLVSYGVDTRGERLTVEKLANFTEVDEFSGIPSALNMTFTQIAPDAATASQIAIDTQFIQNNTGIDWNGFREILFPGARAEFDPGMSAAFDIAPFTVRNYNLGNSEVVFSGGVVPDGGVWTPGAAAGELVIVIDLTADQPVQFTLKEIPTPEPGSLALLAVGALAALRRRA